MLCNYYWHGRCVKHYCPYKHLPPEEWGCPIKDGVTLEEWKDRPEMDIEKAMINPHSSCQKVRE